jgi:hypothetical protein
MTSNNSYIYDSRLSKDDAIADFMTKVQQSRTGVNVTHIEGPSPGSDASFEFHGKKRPADTKDTILLLRTPSYYTRDVKFPTYGAEESNHFPGHDTIITLKADGTSTGRTATEVESRTQYHEEQLRAESKYPYKEGWSLWDISPHKLVPVYCPDCSDSPRGANVSRCPYSDKYDPNAK